MKFAHVLPTRICPFLFIPGILLATALFPSPARAGFTTPMVMNSDAETHRPDDSQPALATDGKGTWLAVWTAPGPNRVNPLGNDGYYADSLNSDIYFARSLDNGQTWGPKTLLKTNAATDEADDLEPSVATDGHGHWMVVWRSMDSLGGTIGYDCDILMACSADNGLTWSDPAPVNTDAATDTIKLDIAPRVASNGKGRWIVSWVLEDHRDIWFREGVATAYSDDNGAHWSDYVKLFGRKVGDGYCGVYAPVMATDGKGLWIICSAHKYQGSPDTDIYYSVSKDEGQTWGTGLALNDTAFRNLDDVSPALGTDGRGNWVCIWSSNYLTEYSRGYDYNIFFSRSTDNAQTWSKMAMLNVDGPIPDGNTEIYPVLATDSQGDWIAAWQTRQWGGDLDIAYAVSSDNAATWGQMTPLNAPATSDQTYEVDGNQPRALALATDQSGRWIAAWNSNYSFNGRLMYDFNILYATLDATPAKFHPTLVPAPAQLNLVEGTRFAVDVTKGGKPTTCSLDLRNDGLAPLSITGLKLAGPRVADFSLLSTPTLPLTLAPETSQPLAIRFAPQESRRALGLSASLLVTTSQTTTAIPLLGDAVPVGLSRFKAE